MANRTAETVSSLRAAQDAVSRLRVRHDTAEALVRKYASALAPATIDRSTVDVIERLEAEANNAAAKLELHTAARALIEAERVEADERERERGRIAESYRPRLRDAVAKLKTALLAARDANAIVQAVQVAQHEATTLPFEPLGWMEFGWRLDTWLDAVKAAGLDD